MADHNLSRVEDQLREGSEYDGPILSRIEKLLAEGGGGGGTGKIGYKGPYDSAEDMPVPGDEGYIYLVSTGDTDDYYDEYYWDEEHSKYNAMGTSKLQLKDYYKKTEVDELIEETTSTFIDAISAETTARQALDTRLSAAISALSDDISAESTARQALDTRLTAAISALNDEVDTNTSAITQLQLDLANKVDKADFVEITNDQVDDDLDTAFNGTTGLKIYYNGIYSENWRIASDHGSKEASRISVNAGGGVYERYATTNIPYEVPDNPTIYVKYTRNNTESEYTEALTNFTGGSYYYRFAVYSDTTHNEGRIYILDDQMNIVTTIQLWTTTSSTSQVALNELIQK